MSAMTPAEALRASESRATPDPAIADALARDAQVREIVGQVDNHPPSVPEAYRSNSGLFVRIYNLYAPSPGDRDDSEEQR